MDTTFKAMELPVKVGSDIQTIICHSDNNDIRLIYNLSLSDIDECLVAALSSTDLCISDTNSLCVNKDGSYECICAPGFERENGTCQCQFV